MEIMAPVTVSIMLRRLAGFILPALLLMPRGAAAEVPTAQDLSRFTQFGAYLAARHAGADRDAAAQAAYYRAALKADPTNKELLDRTFVKRQILRRRNFSG